jgi:hypothetical protein
MSSTSGSFLESPIVPIVVAVLATVVGAYVFLRDTSGELRAMLSAAPGPDNSLKLARAIARLYGTDLAQCVDFTFATPRLRLHEGQTEWCASRLRKLALVGPSDPELEHNLALMLRHMVALTALHAEVDLLRKTSYSVDNARHEEALERLWQVLQPGRLRQGGRHSKDWGDIGFQGTDPSTDFRGMGFLSLLNLLELAQLQPSFCERHIREYLQPGHALTYFPFAITSINATGWLLELLRSGLLDEELLRRGPTMQTVNAMHYALFLRFGDIWERERPASVMDFGRVQKLALAEVKRVGVARVLDDADRRGLD